MSGHWVGLIELLLTFGGTLVALLWYLHKLRRELRDERARRGEPGSEAKLGQD